MNDTQVNNRQIKLNNQ